MSLTADERELLQDTHDSVVALKASCGQCREQVQINRKAIFGNSGWGLKAHVRLLMWLVGLLAAIIVVGVEAMLRSY